MPAIRVLIADDHPLFRKGLRALPATRTEFEVMVKRQPVRRQSSSQLRSSQM